MSDIIAPDASLNAVAEAARQGPDFRSFDRMMKQLLRSPGKQALQGGTKNKLRGQS